MINVQLTLEEIRLLSVLVKLHLKNGGALRKPGDYALNAKLQSIEVALQAREGEKFLTESTDT